MTFKESWEKAHANIHLPDNIILAMLSSYYSESDIIAFDVIEGGCANINILVSLTHTDSRVILRVYLRDKASAHKEKKLSELLKGKLPVPKFHYIGDTSEYTFAIIEHKPGISLRDVLLSNKQTNVSQIMFKVGQALGAISDIKFSDSVFFNYNLEIAEKITHSNLIEFYVDRITNLNVRQALSIDTINQIQAIFKLHEKLLPGDFDKNLVHADFDPANILVVERHGEMEISAILDWEFSFSGSTLFDIANMLRYSHHMPKDFSQSFLEGLLFSGYKLPNSWQIAINLLNIISLLDCLSRTNPDDKPNQTSDIKQLIKDILINFN